MVNVQIGSIQTASWSDNTGMFTGQNIQGSWDSHTPSLSVTGGIFGDGSIDWNQILWLSHRSVFGQPLYDQDVKGNSSPQYMR